MADEDLKWYFNPETGAVEQGKVSSFSNRMGPYDTKEEAAQALEIAESRNEQADAYDEEDDDWGEGAKN